MKHLLSLLVPAMACLLPVSTGHAATDRAELIGLGASVSRIEAQRPRGGFSLGSAITVASDMVVTNCHVTRDSGAIDVVRGGVRWRVESQLSDLTRDLCLLKVPGLQSPVARLGRSADLSTGQSLVAIGYTGGTTIQSSTGAVVELHRHQGSRVIQSTNWFSSGASGGGLFDDSGRLVGILTFRLRGGEAHYYSTPAEWVQQLLDDGARVGLCKVMPLDTSQRPYWQADAASQPRFLRAAVLVREARWSELAATARDGLRTEVDDAQTWFLLGLALGHLGQPAQSRHALECALRIEPGKITARERLAAIDAGAPASTALVCSSDAL